MKTIALEDAQRDLVSIVRNVTVDDPVILTDQGRPVASVTALQPTENAAAARPSLLQSTPVSAGRFLKSFPHSDDDLMGEMLERVE